MSPSPQADFHTLLTRVSNAKLTPLLESSWFFVIKKVCETQKITNKKFHLYKKFFIFYLFTSFFLDFLFVGKKSKNAFEEFKFLSKS